MQTTKATKKGIKYNKNRNKTKSVIINHCENALTLTSTSASSLKLSSSSVHSLPLTLTLAAAVVVVVGSHVSIPLVTRFCVLSLLSPHSFAQSPRYPTDIWFAFRNRSRL